MFWIMDQTSDHLVQGVVDEEMNLLISTQIWHRNEIIWDLNNVGLLLQVNISREE